MTEFTHRLEHRHDVLRRHIGQDTVNRVEEKSAAGR